MMRVVKLFYWVGGQGGRSYGSWVRYYTVTKLSELLEYDILPLSYIPMKLLHVYTTVYK